MNVSGKAIMNQWCRCAGRSTADGRTDADAGASRPSRWGWWVRKSHWHRSRTIRMRGVSVSERHGTAADGRCACAVTSGRCGIGLRAHSSTTPALHWSVEKLGSDPIYLSVRRHGLDCVRAAATTLVKGERCVSACACVCVGVRVVLDAGSSRRRCAQHPYSAWTVRDRRTTDVLSTPWRHGAPRPRSRLQSPGRRLTVR